MKLSSDVQMRKTVHNSNTHGVVNLVRRVASDNSSSSVKVAPEIQIYCAASTYCKTASGRRVRQFAQIIIFHGFTLNQSLKCP